MGADQAVGVRGRGSESGADGVIVELLPSASYRVKLENEDLVLAHVTGASAANFVRLRPGDRVKVELSPNDRTRGRIVELLTKG